MSLVALTTLCTYIDLHNRFPPEFVSFLEREPVATHLYIFLSTVSGVSYILGYFLNSWRQRGVCNWG